MAPFSTCYLTLGERVTASELRIGASEEGVVTFVEVKRAFAEGIVTFELGNDASEIWTLASLEDRYAIP